MKETIPCFSKMNLKNKI